MNNKMGENDFEKKGELEKKLQLSLRGDGKIRGINVEADNLAEASYRAILQCYKKAIRTETPKHKSGGSLGFDANMTITVLNPDSEPKICSPAMVEDPRGIVQYILEVTHGIHNHWKKDKEHPLRWGYTYNERFVDQLPFVFKRIKAEWDERMNQWGKGIGRISGRDYHPTIWRAGEDIILEQEDPPCWQTAQIRFLLNDKGKLVMNYQTHWRSRDLFKAWNENNIAQIELMKLIRDKVSDMLGVPIELGSYIDHSDSLHLYGMYIDKDGLEEKIKTMRKIGCEASSMGLQDYLSFGGGSEQLKALIYAQSLAEKDGYGLNMPENFLKEKGYSLNVYPKEWNTYPNNWNLEPDISKLARVPKESLITRLLQKLKLI